MSKSKTTLAANRKHQQCRVIGKSTLVVKLADSEDKEHSENRVPYETWKEVRRLEEIMDTSANNMHQRLGDHRICWRIANDYHTEHTEHTVLLA